MTSQDLVDQIRAKRSFLCVGLDTDITKLPDSIAGRREAIFEFNKAIVDATADLCVAYKPNLAFYEAIGARGWEQLDKTVKYIREKYPRILTIADAKRGDISNTAALYARSIFQHLGFDAVTVAPYMGRDAVQPFLDYKGKWAIVLALTSNSSYDEFQLLPIAGTPPRPLYEEVVRRSRQWGHEGNMMYVVGATRAEMLKEIRKLAPDHFLLMPGVGQQGGSLAEVVKHGMNRQCGLLVNSARGIIYADRGPRFAQAAREKALELQKEMEGYLREAGIVQG